MRGKSFFVRVHHRTIRLSVSFFAFVLVSTIFCLSPAASAQPTDLWLEASPYTHQNDLFVLGETLAIHIEGPAGDVYDVFIVYDPFGSVSLKREWQDRTVPGSGEIVLTYQIAPSASSIEVYEVQVWDEFQTTLYLTYYYWVILFQADIEVARETYLPGETVEMHYVCWYVQDNGLVTDGLIDWMVLDPMMAVVTSGQKTIASSQDAMGTFSFVLPPGSLTGWYDVIMWLNDTGGIPPDHVYLAYDSFEVDVLSVSVTVDGVLYRPGETVQANVEVRIGSSGAPGADVDIIVRENGMVAPQYGISDLTTPVDGRVSHFFTIDPATPDSTDFVVEAVATVLAFVSSANDSFAVQPPPVADFHVTLLLDKEIYLSGDTATVTALLRASGTTSEANYMFSVVTQSGDPIHTSVQNTSVLQFQIPDDYEGWLDAYVTVKNVEGYEDYDTERIWVRYGLLTVDADEEYEANDDIFVSFTLASNVMASPAFYYEVRAYGVPIESGPAGTDNFTFHVPSDPAIQYEFLVMAVDDGLVAYGSDLSSLLHGYLMSLHFDKESYMPGETMTIGYEIVARGYATLPGYYTIVFGLANHPLWSEYMYDTSGNLSYSIPPDADEGLHIFIAEELGTNAGASEIVRIGNVTLPPEQNVTRLQLQLDNLQANMTSLQTILWDIWNQLNASNAEADNLKATLWDVWDELNTTTALASDLENRIVELEAEVAGLEEELAAAESPPADNTFAYVALLFGIAGLVMGIVAVMRKPPRSRLPEQQPAEEGPTEERGEPETY